MQLFELHTVLNISGESGILTKRFSVFTTEYHIGCWCVINNFYYVETSSLNNYFGTSFFFFLIMNTCWILLNAFFCSYWEWSCGFLFILMWWITLMDLHVLNHPCELGMSLTSFLCVVAFEYANVLLRIFKSVFIKDVCL